MFTVTANVNLNMRYCIYIKLYILMNLYAECGIKLKAPAYFQMSF